MENTAKNSLQNMANNFGGVIHEFIDQDKRKAQRYFVTINGTSISPTLKYDGLNLFMLGIIKGKKLSDGKFK